MSFRSAWATVSQKTNTHREEQEKEREERGQEG